MTIFHCLHCLIGGKKEKCRPLSFAPGEYMSSVSLQQAYGVKCFMGQDAAGYYKQRDGVFIPIAAQTTNIALIVIHPSTHLHIVLLPPVLVCLLSPPPPSPSPTHTPAASQFSSLCLSPALGFYRYRHEGPLSLRTQSC